MFIDSQLLFSEAQAITAAAVSTNVVDLGVARDIGLGEDLIIALLVTTAFTDTGSDSTLTVSLVTDDNASISSGATVATLITFPALAAAGTVRYVRVPIALAVPFERYLALQYTPNNGNLTTGAITAAIVEDPQKYTSYASGFTIA
jgi:hypothetical protein